MPRIPSFASRAATGELLEVRLSDSREESLVSDPVGTTVIHAVRLLPDGSHLFAAFMTERFRGGLVEAWAQDNLTRTQINDAIAQGPPMAPGTSDDALRLIAGGARLRKEYGLSVPRDWRTAALVIGPIDNPAGAALDDYLLAQGMIDAESDESGLPASVREVLQELRRASRDGCVATLESAGMDVPEELDRVIDTIHAVVITLGILDDDRPEHSVSNRKLQSCVESRLRSAGRDDLVPVGDALLP